MASEIRVNKINSSSGVGTITLSPTGVDISGVTTAATLKVGTGVTASSDGDIFATGVCTATSFSGDGSSLTGIAATDNVRTGILDVAGVGTFRGDVNIPDKIIHLGDTNTAIRFPAADTVSVETGGSERARINSDGQLLVGTTETSPYANRTLMTNKNGGNYVSVTTDSSNDCGIVFGDGTANNSANYESYIAHSNSTNDFTINVNQGNDSRHLKVKSTGNVEIGNGNLVLADGHGIDFSAESGSAAGSTSALLDDYEQGSFTATMSNGVTLHSGDDLVYYIKVGNLVTIQAEIRINSSNSNADTVINNLPFVATNHNGNFCPGPVGTYDHTLNSGTSFAFVKTTKNTSTASFQCAGQDGTFRNLDAYGNGYLAFTLVYFTTF